MTQIPLDLCLLESACLAYLKSQNETISEGEAGGREGREGVDQISSDHEQKVQDFLVHQQGFEWWDGNLDIQESVRFTEKIPFEFARDHLLLPLHVRETGSPPLEHVICVCARPWHYRAVDNLSLLFKKPLILLIAKSQVVRDAIGKVYQHRMAQESVASHASSSAETLSQEDFAKELEDFSRRDLLAHGDKEPVARLVDLMLFDALQKRASDVHIHPYPDRLQIRYRIDGVLHHVYQPPMALYEQIVGRIKVLAEMDVSEKRIPQDGRTSVHVGTRLVDLRISTLPTTCGERVVIRILEQTSRFKTLSELGMPPEVEKEFRAATHRSHGLILVTGPTGSGKTTTLYGVLSQLDATQKNILTLEDPVEYQLEGISQSQVASKKGMTFLNGLRHVLRQDPDVILVGEVRDEPTARMVIQSAMTGHLVLTTLHTNSAASAVARLVDLGIEPYLIASSLVGVLAQRLVRQCCRTCGEKSAEHCPGCHGTGYVGRIALYEWMSITETVREHIQGQMRADLLESLAVREGMRTLREEANRLVAAGVTREEEVLRVLGTSSGEQEEEAAE